MMEIDEVMPLYLCTENKDGPCVLNGEECFPECHHTSNPFYAKNKESKDIFEEFTKRFEVVVDDNGRLMCIEREK